jgi:hypothetical protein
MIEPSTQQPEKQMSYRLQLPSNGRKFFATFEEAKKAQRKEKGRIFMLAPGADGTNSWDWIEL